MKLPYRRETLPENIIQILQTRIARYSLLEYIKGNIKSTFVHPEYKWRTTFFLNRKIDYRRIIKYISKIGGI
jgi:hypothetical protein